MIPPMNVVFGQGGHQGAVSIFHDDKVDKFEERILPHLASLFWCLHLRPRLKNKRIIEGTKD
jgi:hypothetical protein